MKWTHQLTCTFSLLFPFFCMYNCQFFCKQVLNNEEKDAVKIRFASSSPANHLHFQRIILQNITARNTSADKQTFN